MSHLENTLDSRREEQVRGVTAEMKMELDKIKTDIDKIKSRDKGEAVSSAGNTQ